jgi:hypothetical protein
MVQFLAMAVSSSSDLVSSVVITPTRQPAGVQRVHATDTRHINSASSHHQQGDGMMSMQGGVGKAAGVERLLLLAVATLCRGLVDGAQ